MLVGKDVTVMNASDTQVVSMVPANNLGSVIVRKDGVVFFVIRVSSSFVTFTQSSFLGLDLS